MGRPEGNAIAFDDFIRAERKQGDMDSSGEFTIAVDGAAIRKLATYSLPFPGAWAVRLVQVAMVGETKGPIQFRQSRWYTTIRFPLRTSPTPERLRELLTSTEPPNSKFLDYLISALRDVGMRQGRTFEIFLPGHDEGLSWDGEQIELIPKPTDTTGFHLQVRPWATGVDSWLKRRSQRAKSQAEELLALRERCFTCPVSLLVDKVALTVNTFALSNFLNYPPLLTKAQARFPVKVKTYGIKSPKLRIHPHTYKDEDEFRLPNWSPDGRPTSTSALILAAASVIAKDDGTTAKLAAQPSQLLVLSHGVLVQQFKVDFPPTNIHLRLFISGEGLGTDLTGFAFRKSDELEQRKAQILAKVPEFLKGTIAVPEDASVRAEESKGIAASLAAAGFIFCFVAGLGPGAKFVGVALGWGIGSLDLGRLQIPELDKDWQELRELWAANT